LSTYLCKLQFENIKRIYRFVEDKEGSLFRIIKENFYLSDKLSLCYSRIIFLCRYRIYCGKKRLRKYKLEDFMACAGLMMQYWSPPRQLAIKILDDNFFLKLAELKSILLEKTALDNLKVLVLEDLKLENISHLGIQKVFKPFVRILFSIGAGLVSNSSIRFFFIDVVEKLVDLLVPLNLLQKEIEVLFKSLKTCFLRLSISFAVVRKYKSVLIRFLLVMDLCVQQFLYRKGTSFC
jgi:hypothetical protein